MLLDAVPISAALVVPPGIYCPVNKQMAASHVGNIQPNSLDAAVAKVIDFVDGKAFGADEVKSAIEPHVIFFETIRFLLSVCWMSHNNVTNLMMMLFLIRRSHCRT